MNVALTRARHAMLVVCNAATLCLDEDWRALVAHAIRSKSFVTTDVVCNDRVAPEYATRIMSCLGSSATLPVDRLSEEAAPASSSAVYLRGLCSKLHKILRSHGTLWADVPKVKPAERAPVADEVDETM